MASAVFVVPMINGVPDVDLATIEGDPVVEGYGYSCIGHVPQADTCLILIYSSSDTLDALAEDERYLFVEDVDG